MKTREEVEHLKANWIADPCYDLEETEGFEEYREELYDFAQKQEIKWEEDRRIRHKIELKNSKVQCMDDPRYNGLTKRELFAAMAMQGMLANGVDRHDAHTNAIYAVQHADALINELNKE